MMNVPHHPDSENLRRIPHTKRIYTRVGQAQVGGHEAGSFDDCGGGVVGTADSGGAAE